MKPNLEVHIIDITKDKKNEKYLYRCLAPMPFRKYKKRQKYLESAIPKGFHKKLLLLNDEVVGQIEYAPTAASGYPIEGENIVVMNCIWVLRKAKRRNFGKQLLRSMVESERKASGFATIALENHWSPWLRREQMEKLGFKSVDDITVVHKTKHRKECFKIHLMWMPIARNARPPTWNKKKLLEGEEFCMAHLLYHPEKSEMKEILTQKI